MVEGIADANGARDQEEVEEDPVTLSVAAEMNLCAHSHLRIKEARVRVDNRNGAIVGLHGIERLVLADHGSQIKAQLLRVHVRLESIGQGLLLASGDFDSILLGGQVTNHARALRIEIRSPETAANELDSDRLGLLIAEGDEGIGRLAIDKLNAKDLSIWEGCRDSDGERRTLAWGIDLLIDDLQAVSQMVGEVGEVGEIGGRTPAWPRTGMD